jgi:CRISPR-associated protein Cas1
VCAKENASEQEFRQQVLQAFIEHKSLEFMFNTIKEITT